ncbi:protein NRT1/ PTR FAMILY 1.2-like [Solanum tuberosum]|uniref:LATD/NIP n=1 Tax=Solanum tuberosum TaxID=4113 RepID=M0ZP29_SOLTU|nr:PREDICTED: protein NRT1/ PTR FAMILY 1.2-like [Solanum tuberosum]KAH0684433.1 hypothetical protein KY289_022185 [Solanum tuberosum]KAH0694884.1 hypothetical protein KY285_021981 [Solanum tuberosum]
MGNKSEQEELLLNHSKNSRKGGLITMPFIIVNESCEKLASYGLLPNMIIYLTTFYHMEAASASVLLALWTALSNGLGLFGAFLSDSYLGRFRAVAIGTISSLIGMCILWLTTIIPQLRPLPCGQHQHGCDGTTAVQLAILLCSFGLISIGTGFNRPCSIAFGADQLENKENPDNERLIDSYFNWYYASVGISLVLAVTVIVYIQDHFGWQIGFAVPALLMIISVSIFLIGSPLYIKAKARGSLFTGLFQVAVAASRKRHINVQLNNNDDCYYREPESNHLEPSADFRCLNRACIIEDPHMELKPDGKVSDPWNLCSVEQVELLKCFLRVLPMWSTCLVLLVAIGQTFSIFQMMTMDRHVFSLFEIPAGSFGIITLIAWTIWVALYDRILVPLLSRYTGHPTGLSPVSRMGISLILGCMATALQAITETIRRNKAIEAGFEDDPNAVLNMSWMWLVPQFALYGVAEAFNVVGQIEFIYSLFPKSMSSFASAMYTFGLAIASLISSFLVSMVDNVTSAGGNTSWLASNINRGHLDYFYWLLTFLSFINLLYFMVVYRFTEHHHDGRNSLYHEAEE